MDPAHRGDQFRALRPSAQRDRGLRRVLRRADAQPRYRPGPGNSVCAGAMTRRFSRAELEGFEGAFVDDLIDERTALLFVGINPGLWTAAVNAHFARRGNRFWPALHRAGMPR